MKLQLKLGIVCVALTIAAGCGGDTLSTQEADLVGGRLAGDDEFSAVIRVHGSCTATKVGPRHYLTAAHCVIDFDTGDILAKYAVGEPFWVTNVNDSDNWRASSVAGIFVHPDYVKACKQLVASGKNCYGTILEDSHAPDVAIMVGEQAHADLPSATIDLDPVDVEDDVVIMGYGCEQGLGTSSFQRLKVHATEVSPAEAADHAGSWVRSFGASWEKFKATYFITAGKHSDSREASLCPGDSGGPVFRDGGTEPRVVGVNAYYSFTPADQAVSETNWHARLDRQSAGAWLEQLGINVVE